MTRATRVRVHLSEHDPHHAPLSTHRGDHAGRPTLLLGLEVLGAEAGAEVWAEACPLPGFGDAEDSVEWARAELCALDEGLLAEWLSQPALSGLEAALAGARNLRSAAARHALEWAVIEALAEGADTGPAELVQAWLTKAEGGSLAGWPLVRQVVSASAVLDPLDPGLVEQATRLAERGLFTWKLKCGRGAPAELRGIEELARLGVPVRLRLDAGCAWTLAQALDFVQSVQDLCKGGRLDLEFVEDPTPDPAEWEDLAALAPVAADEVLAGRGKPLPSARSSAFWLLKPMVHGVFGVLALARHGAQRGQRLVLSHAFDGPLALRASSELACVLQGHGYAAGLGPHLALEAFRDLDLQRGRLLRGERRGPSSLGQDVLLDGGHIGRVLPRRASPRLFPAVSTHLLPQLSPCGGDGLSLSRASALYGERTFLDQGAGGASFAALWALAQTEPGVAGAFLPLVAQPNEAAIAALLVALERQTPVLLLHPSSTAEARQGAIERCQRHAAELRAGDAVIVPTSGSTADPHLVVHTRSSLLAALSASAARLGAPTPETRWLLSLPFSHVGGLMILLRCLTAGACVVASPLPKTPKEVQRLLALGRVTHLSVVPTQLRRWLDDPEFAFPAGIECVLVGGADAPPGLRELALRRGAPVVYSYGLTEMASQVATQSPRGVLAAATDPHSLRLGVGTALPTINLSLTEDGRLRVGGPMLMRTYLGEPEAIEDGLFTTSDLGQLTADGELTLLGRRDDLIISGGENVAPSAVESLLLEVPGVLEVCVLGAPSPTWGQQVVALVVARTPGDWPALERELEVTARARLSPFARPKAYHLWSSLPLLPSGKVDRRLLMSQLASAS